VAPSTLRRWLRQEGERAAEAPAAPTPASAPPGTVRGRLQRRLEHLVETAPEDDPRAEDRMLKICRVMDLLRADADDPGVQLAALERFAAWCLRNLSDAEMAPVRRAVHRFMDQLRREHE